MENVIFEITDAMAKEVKEKFPDLKIELLSLTLDDERVFECIVRKPSNASTARYVSSLGAANREKKDLQRIHLQFCFDNILAPSPERLAEIIEKTELPLLPVSIANELITGTGMSVSSKKKPL